MKPGQPYRILVADDDAAFHGVFSAMLAPASELRPHSKMAPDPAIPEQALSDNFPTFKIDFAFQGQEALVCVRNALAENYPYTMAFIDVRMPPGWNGIETISHIWKECFDLQIVICTGHTDFSWHDLIRRFGHSDRLLILKKPFDMTELRQVAYSLAEKWDLTHQVRSHLERLQKLVSERTSKLQEANVSLQRKVIENQQAERRLVTQYAVSVALSQAATLGEAMEAIFQIVCRSLIWDWGAMWEMDAQTKSLKLSNSWHMAEAGLDEFTEFARSTGVESGSGLPGKVASTGQAAWVRDAFQEKDSDWFQCMSQYGLHGGMAVPLTVGGKVVGVLEFLSRDIQEQSKDILQTFAVIGSAVSQFMERKRGEVERHSMELQLRHAQKMESIGQLAAGIAHEINTPTQYIGDNISFLKASFTDLRELHTYQANFLRAAKENTVTPEMIAEIEEKRRHYNVDFLLDEIPDAIQQSQEGVARVTGIVRAMKEFSHPGTGEKTPVDLNKAIESTLTVASNEWKYVAKIATEFDPNLPLVPCFPGEFNQVVLNLVVNAAHAIADVVGKSKAKGAITVSTKHSGDWVEVRINDTGPGIPETIRDKVFDLFFTTKPVGKGTGQGLAIAHAVIVDQHQGQLTFETEMGVGTTFIIRLPLHPHTLLKEEIVK